MVKFLNYQKCREPILANSIFRLCYLNCSKLHLQIEFVHRDKQNLYIISISLKYSANASRGFDTDRRFELLLFSFIELRPDINHQRPKYFRNLFIILIAYSFNLFVYYYFNRSKFEINKILSLGYKPKEQKSLLSKIFEPRNGSNFGALIGPICRDTR